MVDKDTCTLYELYAARWNGGNPTAGSGAIFDLGSNALAAGAAGRQADAAGLPILPGLVRYDEVAAGAIDHAIRFTVGLHRPQLRVAGPAPGRRARPALPADGRAVPAARPASTSAASAPDAQVVLRGACSATA